LVEIFDSHPVGMDVVRTAPGALLLYIHARQLFASQPVGKLKIFRVGITHRLNYQPLLTFLLTTDRTAYHSSGGVSIKKSSSNSILVSIVSSSKIVRPDSSLLEIERKGTRRPCTSWKSSNRVVTGIPIPPSCIEVTSERSTSPVTASTNIGSDHFYRVKKVTPITVHNIRMSPLCLLKQLAPEFPERPEA
jgi:hypothetical protein